MLHVALYQPTIPPNTGNVSRQCVGMGAVMHLIGPHALDLSSGAVRRAGLDHWNDLTLIEHETPEAFEKWLDGREPWLVTKFGELRYDQPAYRDGDVLVFGNELTGIPPAWHARWPDRRLRIPIRGPVRSYNLSNTVAMVLSQASLKSGLFDF
ncbi:MAG: tRNA (cytidine(34)-2'-O)-methyltransferase [Phycisphaeraceae bacterium]